MEEIKIELQKSLVEINAMVEEKYEMNNLIAGLEINMKELKSSNQDQCRILENDVLDHNKELLDLKIKFKETTETDNIIIDEMSKKNEVEKANFESKISQYELQVGKLNKEIESIQKHSASQENNQEPSSSPSVIEKQIPTFPPASVSFSNKQIQTDRVILSPTPLSVIKSNLEKNMNEGMDATDRVYKSIRDLKCKLSYSKSENNIICRVDIAMGRNISQYPQLMHFAGEGHSEQVSKVRAFENFISSLYVFSDCD